MKEPERIPLTNNPRNKQVKKIRLNSVYDIEMTDDIPNPSDYKTFWKTFTINDENHNENNSQSISELESDSTD